MYFFVKEVFLT